MDKKLYLRSCDTCRFWFKNPATVNNVGTCYWREGMPFWFNRDGYQTADFRGDSCDAWEEKGEDE